MSEKRVGLIIGHSLKSPGAENYLHNISEYTFNTALVNDVSDILKRNLNNVWPIILTRDGRHYKDMPAFVLAHSLDISVEFHANSVLEGVLRQGVSGHEVWYYAPSAPGRFLAQYLNAAIGSVFGNRDRGIKGGYADGNAGPMLRYVGAEIPFALIEPFFICCDKELENARDRRGALAQVLADAILAFLGSQK